MPLLSAGVTGLKYYAVLGIEPGDSCMLGKHSSNRAAVPGPETFFLLKEKCGVGSDNEKEGELRTQESPSKRAQPATRR